MTRPNELFREKRMQVMPHRLASMILIPCMVAAVLAAESVSAREPALIEETTFLTARIGARSYRLHALIVRRADAAGRLPIALITHGKDAHKEQTNSLLASDMAAQAQDFAHRGWLAVAVVRRGFGLSDGAQTAEGLDCRHLDLKQYFERNADDLAAVLDVIARRPDADAGRVLAVGNSAGGVTVLALAARDLKGLAGVINVAGGLNPGEAKAAECPFQEGLVAATAHFGARARVPTLWLYAANDRLFAPQLVRFMHAAYVGAGGKAELRILPPLGDDGHILWNQKDGRRQWLPALDGFLTGHGLPTWDRAALERRIRAELKQDPSRSLIANYLAAPAPKALALALIGRRLGVTVGADDIDSARAESVRACERRNGEFCTVVVENFDFIGEEDPDRVIADLTEALRRDPDDASAHHKRGSVYHAKGDYDRAIKDYDAAIRLDPKNFVALNSRGLAFDSKGRHDLAAADFTAVIKLDPAVAFPYKNRGLVYEKTGELRKALADLRKALFLEAPTPEAQEGAERIEKLLAAGRIDRKPARQ